MAAVLARIHGLGKRTIGWFESAATRYPLRHLPVAGGILAVLAYGAAFAWYAITQLSLVDIVGKWNADDAFYYFTIARNLAAGQFSTFDGGITQTNGYHPLWLLLITPFYWFFDIESALFAIKAFEIMLIAAGFALLVLAARVCQLPWILLLPAIPAFYTTEGLLHGMEAAAGVFLLCLLILTLVLSAQDPQRWVWLFTVVAFLLPWVRLEFAAISVTATATWWGIDRWRLRTPSGASAPGRRVALPLYGAGLGLTVYFAWNWLAFGTAVPVSGLLRQHWSHLEWVHEGGFDLLRSFHTTSGIPHFHGELLIAWSICLAFALLWLWTRASGNETSSLRLAFLAGVSSLAAGHLAKFAQTVLTVHPSWAGDLAWYYAPAYLMMALVVPVTIFVGTGIVGHFLANRSQTLVSLLTIAITVFCATILFARAEPSQPFRYVEMNRDTKAHDPWNFAFYAGSRTLNRVLPDESVIGSWDAGIVGYFSRFPVVNLDGLVNSYDYYRWLKRSDDRRPISPSMLSGLGITHVANTRDLSKGGIAVPLLAKYPLPVQEERWRFVIYEPHDWDSPRQRDANHAVSATSLWRSLVKSADYQADDIAMIVDGSLVQAFARDCDPETWEDRVLLFSWEDGRKERTKEARFVWSKPHPYERSMCTAPFVLPKAAAASEVRVSVSAP